MDRSKYYKKAEKEAYEATQSGAWDESGQGEIL